MDAQRFDALTRGLSVGSRRGLLGAPLALPVVGGLLALLLNTEDAKAKGRRKRRRRRHRHGQNRPKNRRRKRKTKRKKRCRNKPRARICRGKCGIVKNRKTCKKKVNCGACTCQPPCPACQTCDTETVACVPDPARNGQPCGAPGAICQDGFCNPCTDASANLQVAVDATPAGGTLVLCAGDFALDAPLHITRDLTLLGAGAEQTILHGPEADRVLQIASAIAVTVQGLTVTGGTGGITNAGDLTLREVVVTGNTADAGSGGGGIFNSGSGILTLVDSRVVGNAADRGGGIRNTGGTVTLAGGSVVGGDTAEAANTARFGGGIYTSGGRVMLENESQVVGNTAAVRGGGIHNNGPLTLAAGSQVAGNSATDNGGGIVNLGTLTLKAGSRIVGNGADHAGGINNLGGTVTVDSEAFVCGNVPAGDQCASPVPITGNCPNTPGGVCPV